MKTLEKPTVVVRPRGRLAFDPRTQRDAHELLAALASDELNLVLELPNPGHFAAQNALETLGIFIAGNVSATLLPLLVKDLYGGTKSFLVKRFTKNKKASPMYVTIYGPDNKPLKNVLGRSADDIKEIPARREDG